ncbi:hypothetical protein [Marinoscillum furvescens]|uniref:TFIIE alpha subunit n=1 Tax=Marinoscillum furvescens DSM 4134 TaxID=1122208 RepID=A0A3D9LI71_MARFU|nr:hypothetical protein [Marinoscillum furvescens]REE05729.1 TFIIE alpha subunit [Marinoscillum furvescens DSM 4134]
MTDEQFDVLDELYFVMSHDELREATGLNDEKLIAVLAELYEAGWIKIMHTVDEELAPDQVDLKTNAATYYYLASKKGLLAHNS